jgi:hypothetical protein
MATITDFVAGQEQDELLRLTGSTNNPFETVTATGNGTGAYYGAYRLCSFRLLVKGPITGTSPTLDIKFQSSADNSSFSDLGVSFPQVTTTVSAGATGSQAEPARAVVRMPAGRPYLRIVKTVGGTTPSYTGVAVLHDVIGAVV